MLPLVDTMQTLAHALLPQSCFLCGNTAQHALCQPCANDLPRPITACRCCGVDLTEELICGQCLQTPPPYQRTQAVFSYRYPVDKLIQAAKFKNNLAILHYLAQQMAQHFVIESPPDVIIPVPLHRQRLRQRGYNQALELAKVIARKTAIPLNHHRCQRTKNTPPQTLQKSLKARQQNIQGAFQVAPLPLHWHYLVLIDDVVTTGATVKALAQALIEVAPEQIQRIDIWCCARA